MKRGLAWAGFALVTLFSGYWAFVNGFQVITGLHRLPHRQRRQAGHHPVYAAILVALDLQP